MEYAVELNRLIETRDGRIGGLMIGAKPRSGLGDPR